MLLWCMFLICHVHVRMRVKHTDFPLIKSKVVSPLSGGRVEISGVGLDSFQGVVEYRYFFSKDLIEVYGGLSAE